MARRQVFDITHFGARPGGVADCTDAIAAAIAAAAAARRSEHSSASTRLIVRVPPGQFLTRPFNLSSGLELQIDGTMIGAIGAEALERWPQLPPLPTYGRDRDGAKKQRYQALIMASGAHDLRIRGRGSVDGQGAWWWARRRRLRAGRPHLLELYNSSGVELAGVTFVDSPFWTIHPVYSEYIHIHHVKIRAPLYAPNTDGIDPDSSRHVLIEHNDIRCGDDHVAVKAGLNALARDSFPLYSTENVTVRYNTLYAGMGIAIGSETSGGIRGIDVHDNVMHGEGWSVALHVKTTPQRGNMVANISFRHNAVFNTTGFMRLETAYQGAKGKPLPVSYKPTVISNLSWLSNGYQHGDRTRSKWMCPTSYSTCHGLVIKDNSMPRGSTWRCAGVGSADVAGNLPAGLEACMHRGNSPRKSARRKGRHAKDIKSRKKLSKAGFSAACPFCAERDRRYKLFRATD